MFSVFQAVVERLREECLVNGYEALLDADVSGWLFHLLVTQSGVDPLQVHLDARVSGANGFYDVVIGPLATGIYEKPCTKPELVVEVKLFPRIGFTDQQHRVHYEHVIKDDLRKLAVLGKTVGFRAALLVDGYGYLTGTYSRQNRRDFLVAVRDEIAAGVHLCILQLCDGSWRIEHIS